LRMYATSSSDNLFEQVAEAAKKVVEEKEVKITTSKVVSKNLQCSMKRVDLLLRQIRRLSYKEAIMQLKFCRRKIGPKIIQTIERARHKAEARYGLDPERLLLDEIFATKGQYGASRMDYKAKGRFGIMRRKRHHLTVILKEVPDEGQKFIGKWARGVNKETRKAYELKRDRVAAEMGVPPLVVTTKQVELWDLYKEKVLGQGKQQVDLQAPQEASRDAPDTGAHL